ncbi:hypothetical protein R545_25795 [Salmonella enterica subsp. diarizonae serovar Rough:r:z]|uniref:Uncharacterized protein n=4 Tax=Salmonella enterica TaxID=28901 RepID=A0A7Z1PLL7_SALET|nr:hypothetical protein [Salmonella enterica]ECA3795264.1 hypothetical protein [Salmonella enterica subsp. enterica serovar Aqua]OSG79723.1 hypothetical protein R545_25795 [Salmonella enterica subsp. diarizonae serovar Rough:r:z]PTU38566.1 hypothetical protein DBZ43_00190 [Salmonella enterica subsp. enterica]EAA9929127.1 hypothetical protein [Salmonella enterica]
MRILVGRIRSFPPPRYFIRPPYTGVLASQTRHDDSSQSSMIRGDFTGSGEALITTNRPGNELLPGPSVSRSRYMSYTKCHVPVPGSACISSLRKLISY